MSFLKPNKPEQFKGTRDRLVVETWLYQLEQYLTLVQMQNTELVLNDGAKIMYATTLFTSTAASWWFMKVAANAVPDSFQEFKNLVRAEFIPADSVRRARDKLRNLHQKYSVAAYLSEFRNVALSIPGISMDEMLDKFVSGLKPQVRLEVLKSNVTNVDEAARIALNVDSALRGSGMFSRFGEQSSYVPSQTPVPMEIGNVEKRYNNGQIRNRNRRFDPEKEKLYKENRCFVCDKVGCRPWKHDDRKNKIASNNAQLIDSDSEN